MNPTERPPAIAASHIDARRSATSKVRRDRFSLQNATHLPRRFLRVVQSDGLGPAMGRARRKLRSLLRRFRSKISAGRFGGVPGWFRIPEPVDPHDAWRLRNRETSRRGRRLSESLATLSRPIRFSVVLPVYNTPEHVLDAALASVVGQSYGIWELIVVDDASAHEYIKPLLRRWASIDDRIRVVERAENGNISIATNSGAALASGEFLVLFDHDDVLDPDCLAHLALYLEANPDVDLAYSDHDKIDENGRRFAPEFKPDWSPELLLSYCYAGHVKAIRTTLYHELGGLRVGFEGSQDHDLLLRASERARRVGHVPQLLYHWRVLPGSTAASGHEKPASFEAGRRAVEEAFHRRGVDCSVVIPSWAARAGSAVFQPVMPDDGPRVAILIAEEDPSSTSRLIAWLQTSIYRNFHVYVIGSNGRTPKLGRFSLDFEITVLEGADRGRAALWNRAVEAVDEELILFVDGRTEIRGSWFLMQMVGWSRLEGVGAVGPRGLNRQGTLDHAGLSIDPERGVARKVFEGLPVWDQGYLNLARVSRNVSAVSACCFMTRRDRFLSLGGFDAEAFPDDLFDVDYCLRLRTRELRCVISADCEVVVPSASKPRGAEPRAIATFRERYPDVVEPYLSPHVDPAAPDLRVRPTVVPVGPSEQRLRVLAATHNLNWEGAPLIQYELLSALERSSKISAVVVSPRDGPLRARYEEAGIDVEIRPSLIGATDSADRLAVEVRTLADRLADGGFDCLHANTLQTFWAILAARRAGVPSVWSVHESEPWKTYFSDFPAPVAHAALGSLATPYRVVFASRGSLDLWKDLDSHANFERVPTPLDLDRFRARFDGIDRAVARRALGLADGEVCILSLGTVCERKGQHDLLEAFRRLPADAAGRARCVVVGARDGLAYSRDLGRRAAELPADRRDRFTIFPESGDTARFWLAADLFCCTSRIESYPRVVLEAMACGLPLVTTPVFGIAEQVRDQINALYYEPGDHDGLANRLSDLIRDDELRGGLAVQSSWVLQGLPAHPWFVDQYEALFRAAAESFVEPDLADAEPLVPAPARRVTSVRV
ncbi:MAG: glycosyltransferase [Paludisphaera borealis]|uniref:glycosyltransferase n=1 Tax=Paludisphaera borealis TaxID=1387353 RepID=UPI0028428225|nr:glycosyltransferase [Paludisphaera borealis]MDR3622067.1 glycosyltransferase [Paludisphaera borealis]